MTTSPQIVVASSSLIRHELLKRAGIAFTVDPADIDEVAIRDALTANDAQIAPADVAEVLARAKGERVSARQPGSIVIAADQVLALGDRLFSKPADIDEARATLMELRGKTHQLHAAVVLALDDEIVWSHVETAHMTMRDFSVGFVSEYMLRAGAGVCSSVGAYQLEGLGVQLFEKIEGDYFTILGLPMLPLLSALRDHEALAR